MADRRDNYDPRHGSWSVGAEPWTKVHTPRHSTEFDASKKVASDMGALRAAFIRSQKRWGQR